MYEVSRPLGLILTNLLSERAFQVGLAIKICFLICIIPITQTEWFVPFILFFFNNPSLTPWDDFINSGGNLLAFPYGATMLLSFLPVTSFGWLLDNVFNSSYFTILGFQLTLLIADIFLLLTLIQQFDQYRKQLIVYYWLSPLIFYITYWHGQIDLIPVAFLFYSVGLLKK